MQASCWKREVAGKNWHALEVIRWPPPITDVLLNSHHSISMKLKKLIWHQSHPPAVAAESIFALIPHICQIPLLSWRQFTCKHRVNSSFSIGFYGSVTSTSTTSLLLHYFCTALKAVIFMKLL